MKRRPMVVSLCDLTGNFVKPWVEAGYGAILVDPQHRLPVDADGHVIKLGLTVEEAATDGWFKDREIAFVAGFPPCTDLAVSGPRWFKEKAVKDPYFQIQAARVVEQCRMVGMMSGAPWFVENPVSVLSSILGKPDYSFHPHDYTHFEPKDHYTKKTCLWTGGGFVMPPPKIDPEVNFQPPDDRIHKAPPSEARANFRSATPMGFARAVFEANHA